MNSSIFLDIENEKGKKGNEKLPAIFVYSEIKKVFILKNFLYK
jgi:hypothetical protein